MVSFDGVEYIVHETSSFAALIFNSFGGYDACLVQSDVKGEAHPVFVHTHPAMT